MSYLTQENNNPFLYIKLTDEGRKLLSLGQLNFSSVVINDSEINYLIDPNNNYDIKNNRILAPKDINPPFLLNFDNSAPVALKGYQVGTEKEIITAATPYYGFFLDTPNNFLFDVSLTSNGSGFSKIDYSVFTPNGSNYITIPSAYYHPAVGELAYITWHPKQANILSYNSAHNILSSDSYVGLWYKVTRIEGDNVYFDRNIPNFGDSTVESQSTKVYFYPNDAINTVYSPDAVSESRVWNMNIVHTNSVIGTSIDMSGYTSYGSIEYNGTKIYLGLTGDSREIGIIHYTNNYSGNTNAEYWIDGTVSLEIPNILWHKGNGTVQGLSLTDADPSTGATIYDSILNTTYRNLKDGTSTTSNIVGRVYHKLQIIVITDPEVLLALTYKSNRNYTLPPLNLGLSTYPKDPLTTNDVDGLCKAGKTYFVTYVTESLSSYTLNSSYGYPKTSCCGYISKIDGVNDANGNPQYLTATFPTNSFPYMRNTSNLTSGTGWNANDIKLIIKEVNTTSQYTIESIPSDNWIQMGGQGTYNATLGSTIDPNLLNSYQFIVSQQDYDSGSTYQIDADNNDLKYGDETFFFGNLKFTKAATIYKSIITVFAKNDQFNSSLNPSFDSNENTYITAFGILDSNNVMVAIAKPSYPIKKNDSRYLVFQLELDF